MDVIETVCDRVLIMSDGEFVADDSVDALLRSTDVYGVRVVSSDFDESILTGLGNRFEVTSVEPLAPGARVEVETEGDGIYELMDWLRANDVTPERVMTVKPGLEDLFLDLTDQDTRPPGGELE